MPGETQTGDLNVQINCFFQVNQAETPVDKFLSDWRKNIQQDWNDKIEFSNAGINKNLKVRFDIKSVASAGAAHFPVLLVPGYAAGSGVKFPSPTADPFSGRIYLQLADRDNQPYYLAAAANAASGQIGSQRHALLDDTRNQFLTESPGGAGADHFEILLKRVGANWQIDPAIAPALDNFCLAMSQTPQGVTQPPLRVQTSSGLLDKSWKLSQTVVDYLRARGVKSRISINVETTRRKFKSPFADHKTTASANIEVEGVLEMAKGWRSDYVVSSHEFGHLLGVPDEYLSYATFTNGTIRDSQPLWDKLCYRGNVPRRNWGESANAKTNNTSMMSLGRQLFPAHAITIWDQLCQVTKGPPHELPPNSWAITKPTA